MSRTLAIDSIQVLRAKIAAVARGVARSYGKTLAATGTLRMRPHHPVRVLALRIALAVRWGLQRRTERRRPCGRRIPEADDDDAPGCHRIRSRTTLRG